MILKDFEYAAPKKIDEAIAILEANRERVKLLAGGQSLIPLMKLGLASPEIIVDLKRIRSLSYIKAGSGKIAIGALTRHVEIADSKDLRRLCPMLPAAAKGIGHTLIRTRGTIGGSLVHCDPRADYIIVLLALGASLVARSSRGARTIPISEFMKGPFETALEVDEILTEITVPIDPGRPREIFRKHELGHGDFGLAFAAVRIWVKDHRCAKSVIYVSGFDGFPIRLHQMEAQLSGQPDNWTVDGAVDACVLGLGESQNADNLEYMRGLVATLLKRSLKEALRERL